ncbi:MAG: hypothetical protein ASARMPREDX12_001203 [Alectoria sarmentosa]|nr:MAG: hypothetical protein ASARMPREDX12_001203 [Alectoria sarmentosa]
MAGPKEEWLIWDGRFQFGYSCLNRRMKINEEATQRIAQLDRQNEALGASSTHLQDNYDGLRDRIQQLEHASYRTAQLDEQILDLTASSRDLKEENNSLSDRILQLEREGTRQDQENRLIQQQLEAKLEAQEDGFKSVLATMRGMNEIARAERGQRGEEIQKLKSQVEALAATRHTLGGHARDGKSRESVIRRASITFSIASREMSEATTEDESMLINQHAKHQQLNAAHQDIEVQSVLIKAQTPSKLLEDHLRYAEKAFKRYETEAAQAFVNSVRKKYQIPLRNKLDERGEWTWQAAMQEGYRMAEAEKKTERRSTRLMARAT